MKQILIVALLIITAFCSRAQTPMVKHYWLNERKLPVKINDLAQDSLGYLWLATNEGVYRYNGLDFVKIGGDKKQKATAVIYVGGKLVVGLEGGALVYVSGLKLLPYKLSGYNGTYDVINFNKKSKGEFWACTEAGVWAITNDKAKHLSTSSGLSDPYSYDADFSKDKAIIASDKGLSILSSQAKAGTTQNISVADGLSDNIVRAISIIGNKIFIGTQTGGIQLYDLAKKQFNNHNNLAIWNWGAVVDIEVIDSQRALAATASGAVLLMQILPNDAIFIKQYAHISAPIHEIFLDKTGNLWCGTDNGLSLILAERISHIELPNPYNVNELTAISVDRQGRLWLAQENKLYVYNPALQHISKVLDAPGKITCLYFDEQQNLWMGTINHGVHYLPFGAKKIVTPAIASLANTTVLSIQQRGDEIWLAGLNGIDVLTNDAASKQLKYKQHFSKKDGAGSDYIYALYKDRANNMWIASDGGSLRMYDGRKFKHWPELSNEAQQVAYTITEDGDGNIWFAGLDYKLNKYANGKWTSYENWPQDNAAELSVLTSNSSNYILRCFGDHIEFFNDKRKASWRFEISNWLVQDSFGKALNCFAKDSSGNIYLPISSGLLLIKKINPAALAGQNVVIQKITNNGLDIDAHQHQFSAGENYFTFQFDAIFFSDTRRFYYRYKLSGNNEDWIYTNMNYASFSNLPAGKYNFIVQAATDEKFLNFAEQRYEFQISKPLWARWWFPVIVSLVLILIVYLYNNRRLRHVRKIAAIEQQRAHFQYEYLRSQINPHFLFNSLNTLTALIEEEPDQAVAYTENLSDFYRNTITRLDQSLISLQEEIKILESYIQIQQYRFGEALKVVIEIDAKQQQQIRVVPMALQFLVENAVKHNVVSKAAPLLVRIYIQDNCIVVENKINRKQQVLRSSNLGLKNIEQRYTQHTTQKMRHTEDNGWWKVFLPIVTINE